MPDVQQIPYPALLKTLNLRFAVFNSPELRQIRDENAAGTLVVRFRSRGNLCVPVPVDLGRWQGDQLIDSQWLDDSFVPATEHSERLGLIWFLEHDEDEVVGAFHSGYLGQWVSIRFDKRLVGVRMVASTPAYDGQTDGFRDFVEHLPSLVE